MKKSKEKFKEARDLYAEQSYGVLSTLSQEVPGYPFGSVTPYAMDENGHAVILISNLAQHFKNIRKNPKVSLIILEGGGREVQAQGRLTYLADVVKMEGGDQRARDRYFNQFPESREYGDAHGFFFFRLKPVRLRYIGGFGKITWIEPEEFFVENPFTEKEERGILNHMNRDHAEAVKHYLFRFKNIEVSEKDKPEMVEVDGEGFNVLTPSGMVRFSFETFVSSLDEARKALVAMAKK